MDWLSLERLSAGRVLRLRRVRLGLSQRQLADLAGTHPSLASELERDTPPAARPAGQLAAASAKLGAALAALEPGWQDAPDGQCSQH
jgi:transcriptional regulator with XRE-family HTH domain